MERENADLADCFNFYLAEQGFDQAHGLPDAEHRKVIQGQYVQVSLTPALFISNNNDRKTSRLKKYYNLYNRLSPKQEGKSVFCSIHI